MEQAWFAIDESNTTEKCKRSGCRALRWNQWWCQDHAMNAFLAGIQFKSQTGLEIQDDWFQPEQGFAPPCLRPGLNIIVLSGISATPARRDRSPKRVKKQPAPKPKTVAAAEKEKVKKAPAPAKAKATPKASPPPVKRPPKVAPPKANPVANAQETMARTVARYLPTKTISRPPNPLTPEAGYKLAKEKKQQQTAARVKLEAKLNPPVRVKRETE